MILEKIDPADFDAIYTEMEQNFVLEERRDKAHARAVLEDPNYTAFHLVKDGIRVGFVTIWQLEKMVFVEHLVVYAAHRNGGHGSVALRLLQQRFGALLLEVEHPDNEMAARRIGFYERNGFHKNKYPYVQPPYRKEGIGVPLILMSYPVPLSHPERVAKELQDRVYRVPRVEMILDTDFGSDCDDAMALAYLVDAERRGAVCLKAVTHSNGCAEGPDAIRVFFEDLGEPVPPIGRAARELRAYDHYCKQIVERFDKSEKKHSYEDAVKVLRRALCESRRAVICAVGAMTNIAALLKSAGDEISPLDGVSLLRERCERIVLMAGIFDPDVERTEWNIHLDIPAAQTVAERSPVPVVWLPSETGAGIMTGGPILQKYGDGNPLALAFTLFPGVIQRGGRSSWDPATVLYGFEGCGAFLAESPCGTVTVNEQGKTAFSQNGAGNHRILTLKGRDVEEAIAARIDQCAARLYAYRKEKI